MADYFGHVHRQSLADDIAFRSLFDGRLSPVVPQLITDESILGESCQKSLGIEAVCCFNVGGHQGWEGDRKARRNRGFHHRVEFEAAEQPQRARPTVNALARCIL